MTNIFKQEYFKRENQKLQEWRNRFKPKPQDSFKFHSFGTLGTDTIPSQHGDEFEFFRYKEFIPTGTFTIPVGPIIDYSKPKRKRKAEPKHRFLKNKDIDNLLDKYFNGKENSV